MAVYTITLDQDYTGSQSGSIYWESQSSRFYSDSGCTNQIVSIPVPRREQFRFKGYFLTSSFESNKYVDETGVITQAAFDGSFTLGATWIAHWERASYKCTIDANGGYSGIATVYRSSTGNGVFADDLCVYQLQKITIPKRSGYSCTGITRYSSTGAELVDADGNILSAFNTLSISEDITVYSQWITNCKIYLNAHGGVGGTDAIWYDRNSSRFTSDDASSNVITKVDKPTKNGYTFNGYYTASSGGTRMIYTSGTIRATYAPSFSSTLHAQWSQIQPGATYTLSFDTDGGSGAASPVSVQVGVAVGTLPSPSKSNYQFIGWYIGETLITSNTIWNYNADKTAVARWSRSTGLGAIVDYFSMASNTLIPISSNAGDNKMRICCSHTGRYESDVGSVGGVWRNPTVVYKVVGDMTLSVGLGRAFASSGSNVSGYMITGVDVSTEIGEFPTVVVSGSANEGADAINIFNVSIPIEGNAHAQNLLSALSGGGHIQSCSLSARCDPIVCAENMMPCASDVVNGQITVSASTLAPSSESAPSASSGFVSVGEPKLCRESNVPGYSITVKKEIV